MFLHLGNNTDIWTACLRLLQPMFTSTIEEPVYRGLEVKALLFLGYMNYVMFLFHSQTKDVRAFKIVYQPKAYVVN
jgi:hypothetical protein